MNYREYEEKKKYLLYLIYKERLFEAREAARKFSCSERTIFRIIESLKNQGYQIKWSRAQKKYFLADKSQHPEIEYFLKEGH